MVLEVLVWVRQFNENWQSFMRAPRDMVRHRIAPCGSIGRTYKLRYVQKLVLIIRTPLQIVRFHQRINPLLYLIHIGLEMTGYRINSCNLELLKRKLLAGLHYPHNRGVEVVLSVTLDGNVSAP